ncbi:heterodisulfide reductase-related iron-sulfur binding cluster [Granulicella sp. dw_53]|uniref:(Fe-S)-binding protein n=1 Tax=Granulicella sp. dw_53 TaxID=2719792 RepID=UPI001BD328FC|nr:heterodisulfide reductase-related iron-sulfur binding cluster [Granulicella sp. dw_53]
MADAGCVAVWGARLPGVILLSNFQISATLAEPERFSGLEMGLLVACVMAAGGLFFWRFAPILNRILHSKKDADFSLRPVGRRVWEFVWEVLCQAKVIRQRPLPGVAHAFVFWGFLAFALVSLNHFATGVELGFLTPDGVVGRFYFVFAGVWALLVAVSIAGLFVRRFFVRPVWLGEKVSYESGLIALLIFALMVTYLAAFFVEPGGVAVKALWWTHTLALLVFLPLIPHTKHLHLVLSPLTVFLKRDGFSKIPPLSGDEDFGLVAGKDITQLISLQAYSCVECGRCTEHCPASTTGKVLNPKEIILGMRSYLNEFGPASEMALLSEARVESPDNPPNRYMSMEAAFECTTCGSCEYQCPVGIQHLPIIVGLRRGATNTGAWEDTYGTKLFLALEKNGNALGLSAMERDKFVTKQGLPIFDGSQEYCLWLGCMGGYDPKGREIIADFARVMSYLGTTFGVLKKEKCTGDPARRLGNDLVFQTMAEYGLKALEAAKVQKIVAICPHCVRTISNDWREYGIAPEIEHHSEFMARYKDRLPKQVAAAGESIVYHDPCYLGRYRDVYEEPREIVALAGTLVEAERSHERSFCCGAGGGLAFLGEESGERVSHVRAKELMETGAQTIGTACPFCNTMFRDAVSAVGGGQVQPQLLDIAQLTARALPDVKG